MTTYIPLDLQKQIRADVGKRCGYCRSSEEISGLPLEFEHLIPLSAGGLTVRENLWRACRTCNKYKGDRTQIPDPETGELVALFNPRTDIWSAHFQWGADGSLLVGRTNTGRATVVTLQMNNLHIVNARRFWIIAGWHPPTE